MWQVYRGLPQEVHHFGVTVTQAKDERLSQILAPRNQHSAPHRKARSPLKFNRESFKTRIDHIVGNDLFDGIGKDIQQTLAHEILTDDQPHTT